MGSVVVAHCHPLTVAARFVDSLTRLLRYDAQGAKHIEGTIDLLSGPRIAEARSQIVDHFLLAYPDADWLLMLDADMTFDETIVEDLLAVASPSAPIVGGLCFAGIHGLRIYPTVYRAYNEDDGHLAVEPVDDYPRDALIRVGATGAACLLIHKGVFGAMRRPGPTADETLDPSRHGFGTMPDGRPNPFPWFAEGLTTSKGISLGEDIAFSRRAMLLGIPIHVHTGIRLGHCKEWPITEADYDAYRQERDRPPQSMIDAALATLRGADWAPDDVDAIAAYLQPRPSIAPPFVDNTPHVVRKPQPFKLPEPVG